MILICRRDDDVEYIRLEKLAGLKMSDRNSPHISSLDMVTEGLELRPFRINGYTFEIVDRSIPDRGIVSAQEVVDYYISKFC